MGPFQSQNQSYLILSPFCNIGFSHLEFGTIWKCNIYLLLFPSSCSIKNRIACTYCMLQEMISTVRSWINIWNCLLLLLLEYSTNCSILNRWLRSIDNWRSQSIQLSVIFTTSIFLLSTCAPLYFSLFVLAFMS
jgi:hypothetical protein